MIIFTVEVNVRWRINDAQLARNNVDAGEPKCLCTFLLGSEWKHQSGDANAYTPTRPVNVKPGKGRELKSTKEECGLVSRRCSRDEELFTYSRTCLRGQRTLNDRVRYTTDLIQTISWVVVPAEYDQINGQKILKLLLGYFSEAPAKCDRYLWVSCFPSRQVNFINHYMMGDHLRTKLQC